MDDDVAHRSRARKLSAALTAGSALGVGFVALAVWYNVVRDTAARPGLYAFRSATWGDGIAVPVLLGACVWLGGADGASPRSDRVRVRWLRGGGRALVGGLAGIALIVSWLADPSPQGNWTFPRAHTFTRAGCYHALFLVAASAAASGLWLTWLAALRRARKLDSSDPAVLARLRSPALALAFAGICSYGWLAVADAQRGRHTTANVASLVSLVIAAAVIVVSLWVAAGPALLLKSLPSVGVGAIASCCFLLFVYADPARDTLLGPAVVSALGAGLAAAGLPAYQYSRRPHQGLFVLACTATYVGLTCLAYLVRSTTLTVSTVPLMAMLACYVLSRFLTEDKWTGRDFAGLVITGCLHATAVFALWLEPREAHTAIAGGFLLTILGAVLGGILLPYFKGDFATLMLAESGGSAGPDQQAVSNDVVPRIVGYSLSAFSGLLALTIAVSPSLGWVDTKIQVQSWQSYAAGGIAFGLLLLCWGPVRGDRYALNPEQDLVAHPERQDLRVLDRSASPLSGWCHGHVIASTVAIGGLFVWSATETRVSVLAIVVAVLFGLSGAHTIVSNGVWLHFGRVGVAGSACALAGGAAVASTTYWAMTYATHPRGRVAGLLSSLGAWAISALTVGIVIVVATTVNFARCGRSRLTPYSPTHNATQDAGLLIILSLVTGWLPQEVLAHVPRSAVERWAAVGSILTSFLFIFGPIYLWVLENNDTHVGRQWLKRTGRPAPTDLALTADDTVLRLSRLGRRVGLLWSSLRQPPSDIATYREEGEAFSERLAGHTGVQNLLSLGMAALTAVGVVGVGAGFTVPDPDRSANGH